MLSKVTQVEYKGERLILPCPIYVDTDKLGKTFVRSEDLFLYLLAKSISEETKERLRDNEKKEEKNE